MASSQGRAIEWANVITSAKNVKKPSLWSSKDNSLVKKKIETFSKFHTTKSKFFKDLSLKTRFVTAVGITNCGNFGIAGFNDGYILKISMESGSYVKTFWNKTAHNSIQILGCFSDAVNHFLISADNEKLARWDFYSGKLEKIDTSCGNIKGIYEDQNSNVFMVKTGKNNLFLFEIQDLKKIREFNLGDETILDCCLVYSARKVIASTDNASIKIWDIFSETLIYTMNLDKPIIAMTFNPDITLLATVFIF